MICREIIQRIEEDYPKKYALEWDNVGLLAGRDDKEVRRIYLAVDATDAVVAEAAERGADLLITHHPLIFGGRKKITNEDFIGNRLVKLIQNDISYYAMHTNYDVLEMGALAGEMLGLRQPEVLEETAQDVVRGGDGTEGQQDGVRAGDVTEGQSGRVLQAEGIGKIGELEQATTLKEYAGEVKRVFSVDKVKVFGELDKKVRRIAVCPGSGGSVIGAALAKGADVLVTGDIGHHDGIDAAAQGLAIIDAGHYGIEHIFVEDMRRYLTGRFDGIIVEGEPVRHPFVIL